MAVKECSHHKGRKKKLIRRLFAGILIILFILLVIFLIIWAILQPKKPRFILQDATIFSFNVTAPVLLSSNFHVTVSSRNPNDKVGIYYDRLDVYATYHSQQITYYTQLPPSYQGHKDVTVWSPFIYGTNVPVAPYNGVSLTQDQQNGVISLLIKINGRVRWKVGSIITGRYHLHVNCQAYIPFGNGNSGSSLVGVKYQLDKRCSVSV